MAGVTKGQESGGTRSRFYRFPDLGTAREEFVKWLRVPSFDWMATE